MTDSLMPLIHDRIAQLRAHPDVHVLAAHLAPPSPRALEAAVECCGFDLDPVMLDFYQHCNGLYLRWTHPMFEEHDAHAGVTLELSDDPNAVLLPGYSDENLPGICFLPVECFASAQYAEGIVDAKRLDPSDIPEAFCDEHEVDADEVFESIRIFSHRGVEEAEGLFTFGSRHFLAWSEEQTAMWEAYPHITFAHYARYLLGSFGVHPLRPWQSVWTGTDAPLRWSAWEREDIPEGWPYIADLDEVLVP